MEIKIADDSAWGDIMDWHPNYLTIHVRSVGNAEAAESGAELTMAQKISRHHFGDPKIVMPEAKSIHGPGDFCYTLEYIRSVPSSQLRQVWLEFGVPHFNDEDSRLWHMMSDDEQRRVTTYWLLNLVRA